MDVVYPYRDSGNGNEFRHSLRSLTNLQQLGTVWVVGDQPAWLTGARHIPGNRHGTSKPRNVLDNIRLAAEHPDMPEQFLLMNDDFYLMQPYTARVEHRGPLRDQIDKLSPRQQRSWWGNSLRATHSYLRKLGHTEPLSYEGHKPLLVDTAAMAKALAEAAATSNGKPLQGRSIYGNRADAGGTQTRDYKIYLRSKVPYEEWPYISTNGESFARHPVGQHIRAQFPTPSPYELEETRRV